MYVPPLTLPMEERPTCSICLDGVLPSDLYVSPCSAPEASSPPHCFHRDCVRDYVVHTLKAHLTIVKKQVRYDRPRLPQCPNCRQGNLVALFRTPKGVKAYLIDQAHSLIPVLNVIQDGRSTPQIREVRCDVLLV